MHPVEANPRNTTVLRSLSEWRGAPFSCNPRHDVPDPYLGSGSHPDIVERVWDQLGAELPEESRQVVCATPALVELESGLILAVCMGTSYCIRVSNGLMQTALAAGCTPNHCWADGNVTDLTTSFGPGWVFGCWDDSEESWIRAAAAELMAD